MISFMFLIFRLIFILVNCKLRITLWNLSYQTRSTISDNITEFFTNLLSNQQLHPCRVTDKFQQVTDPAEQLTRGRPKTDQSPGSKCSCKDVEKGRLNEEATHTPSGGITLEQHKSDPFAITEIGRAFRYWSFGFGWVSCLVYGAELVVFVRSEVDPCRCIGYFRKKVINNFLSNEGIQKKLRSGFICWNRLIQISETV